MTDRELMELAAKAAGFQKDDSPCNGGVAGNYGFDIMGNMVLDWHNDVRWNPLTNDGDALRLANKRSIDVLHNWESVRAQWEFGKFCREKCTDETRDAATRRAITRAAAEIGKAITKLTGD